MKTFNLNKSKLMLELTSVEIISIEGGYVEPTEEQLASLERIYGPWARIIVCW